MRESKKKRHSFECLTIASTSIEAEWRHIICLSSRLQVGWLAFIRPSYRCTCLTGYTDLEMEAEHFESLDAFLLIQSSTVHL
jgi:hypothetical protein